MARSGTISRRGRDCLPWVRFSRTRRENRQINLTRSRDQGYPEGERGACFCYGHECEACGFHRAEWNCEIPRKRIGQRIRCDDVCHWELPQGARPRSCHVLLPERVGCRPPGDHPRHRGPCCGCHRNRLPSDPLMHGIELRLHGLAAIGVTGELLPRPVGKSRGGAQRIWPHGTSPRVAACSRTLRLYHGCVRVDRSLGHGNCGPAPKGDARPGRNRLGSANAGFRGTLW